MRLIAVLALAAAGCHRDKPSGPTPIGPSPRTDAAAIGSAAEPHAGTPAPAPPREPPSEALTAPPDDLAEHVKLATVATGFDRPVDLVVAPGDARRRLFVVEQTGRIRVIEHGERTATVFFDLAGGVSSENEQGLLGLAFHPKFADNRKLYVDYTDRSGDTHVVEYQVGAGDPDRVDPKTARELLRIDQPFANHNGGNLVFGPDGALWIGTGDGGAAGDPYRNGQNPHVLLGKMLRLDVDTPDAKPEIAAIGLRNPWRYSFDAKTGDLYIGDVGQNLWESVYVVPAAHRTGLNFGWNVAEGRHCFDADRCDRSAFTPPVADYPHADGCSITGGFVYRGKALPALDGVYFYADYCTAFIRSFRWAEDGIRWHWDWKAALDPDGTLAQVASFGVDADGELYVLLLSGEVLELVSR